MKPQIFVVEGRNDVTRLKHVFPDLNVVSVNGSAINEDIINLLKNKVNTHEIVLCMDPDYPGEKIRKTISMELKNVSHIFIDKNIAYSKNKKKIGLEHLNNDEIKKLLKNIVVEKQVSFDNSITLDFLYNNELIGHINSNKKRNELAKKLNIGYVNGKTLLKRLKQFNISQEEVLNNLSP